MNELNELHKLIIENLVGKRADHLRADQLIQAIKAQLEAGKGDAEKL